MKPAGAMITGVLGGTLVCDLLTKGEVHRKIIKVISDTVKPEKKEDR